MASGSGGGERDEGWTPEEKTRGMSLEDGSDAAGEAKPKGRPRGDDRAATESAAGRIEQDNQDRDRPGKG